MGFTHHQPHHISLFKEAFDLIFFLKFKSEFKVKLKINKNLNLELKLIDIFVVLN